jgi:hypothetical protein
VQKVIKFIHLNAIMNPSQRARFPWPAGPVVWQILKIIFQTARLMSGRMSCKTTSTCFIKVLKSISWGERVGHVSKNTLSKSPVFYRLSVVVLKKANYSSANWKSNFHEKNNIPESMDSKFSTGVESGPALGNLVRVDGLYFSVHGVMVSLVKAGS